MTATGSALARPSSELIGAAVQRSPRLSVDGMLERAFTLAFSGLVYPQIWEDPLVDLAALAIHPECRIVAIASGGCNVLSYLIDDPARIFAVDLNAAHVALNRLKVCAVRKLPNHDAFLRFFGSATDARNVAAYDRHLKPHLDAATRDFWEGRDLLGRRRVTRFRRGFYRTGLLGRFIGAAHLASRLHGRNPRAMLSASSLEEQRRLYAEQLAPLFRSGLIRRVLDHRVALYGLGIPPAQFDSLKGDQSRMSQVLEDRLARLACDFPISQNYFAWQAFGRGYSLEPDAPLPPYLERRNFEAIRVRANRIDVHQSSLTEFLARQPDRALDRFVLLDAQDWMPPQVLDGLWLQITRTARPDARVIFRTAAPQSVLPGRLSETLLSRWQYQERLSHELGRRDRSAIYGGFHLYTLKAREA